MPFTFALKQRVVCPQIGPGVQGVIVGRTERCGGENEYEINGLTGTGYKVMTRMGEADLAAAQGEQAANLQVARKAARRSKTKR